MDIAKKWIPRSEAAEILGVDPQTISNYAKRGIIHERKTKSFCYYPVEEIEALAKCEGLKDYEQIAADIERMKAELKSNYKMTSTELAVTRSAFLKSFGGGIEAWRRYTYLVERVIDICAEDALTERERGVISSILKLQSINEISEWYGLSRERTRQIFEKGLRKIAKFPERMKDKLAAKDLEVLKLKEENEKLRNLIEQKVVTEIADNGEPVSGDDIFRLCKPFTTKIEDLYLSVRAWNCLKALGIKTLGDLVGYKRRELMKCRNCGRKTLNEIDDLLERNKLTYEMWRDPERKY